MEVLISVHGERVETRALRHCGSAYATVVSVDREGGPVPVPFYLTPETAIEQRRCQVPPRALHRKDSDGNPSTLDLHTLV